MRRYLFNAFLIGSLLAAGVVWWFWWDSANDLDYTHVTLRISEGTYLEFHSAQDVFVFRIIEQRRLNWAPWGVQWTHVDDDGDLVRWGAWHDAKENGMHFLGFGLWFKEGFRPVSFGMVVPQWLVLSMCLLPGWVRWRRSKMRAKWMGAVHATA